MWGIYYYNPKTTWYTAAIIGFGKCTVLKEQWEGKDRSEQRHKSSDEQTKGQRPWGSGEVGAFGEQLEMMPVVIRNWNPRLWSREEEKGVVSGSKTEGMKWQT